MNSWYHARSSARKWGGDPQAYLPVHSFIDGSKSSMPDIRHRALLHSSFGIFMVESVFGACITVPRQHASIEVPTRLIAEQHVLEDLGFIPTVDDWLGEIEIKPWMGGKMRTRATVSMTDFVKGA